MSREAAPSREAGSALAVMPGDAEPSDAFLEAMVREESWLQTVRATRNVQNTTFVDPSGVAYRGSQGIEILLGLENHGL